MNAVSNGLPTRLSLVTEKSLRKGAHRSTITAFSFAAGFVTLCAVRKWHNQEETHMKITRALSLFLALMLATALGYAQGSASGASDQTKASTTTKSKKSATNASAKLDINAATKDQLDALPGIGSAYSQKIIDGRPYHAKNDLVRRNIIPQPAYDKIKDQIIAHHAAGSASAKKGTGTSK
jgi:competence protein ComEA